MYKSTTLSALHSGISDTVHYKQILDIHDLINISRTDSNGTSDDTYGQFLRKFSNILITISKAEEINEKIILHLQTNLLFSLLFI